MADERFACVSETHYIHLEVVGSGKPCNSSIGPASWTGDDLDEDGEPQGGWSCIGCRGWWPMMPDMEPEGLAALCRMKHEEDQ